ncbi:MAG: CocE/NonD family hydrolase [Rhodospirillales bacterium]|nr:CocE/NonD family hydrolase [Rhodospirillales bacterium]
MNKAAPTDDVAEGTAWELTEVRDGMIIDWDVPIRMDDGIVLRADVFRPRGGGTHPVILSYGPYGKWLSFQEGYSTAWEIMARVHPDALAGSSDKYQSWEVADPEKWVPDGYALVRVDSRGAGRSPGFLDPFCPRETADLAQCIEWAGVQPWSNGKVGLNGISYYAINAWQVAVLQPPHLAAICAWEGASDWYREKNHHGGILCTFQANWYDMQVKPLQHGHGVRGARSPIHGGLVCGPETLPEEELARLRCDFGEEIFSHPLDDTYHRARSVDWSRVVVPLLSAANWGGNGLHLRGNIEGFVNAASKQKWLEVHGGHHWTGFYTDYGVALQKRFFGHFLKGEDTGWSRQPAVQLQIRAPAEKFTLRHESEWPLDRAKWTRYNLDLPRRALTERGTASGTVAFEALDEGVRFLAEPATEEFEITGPIAARLAISSSTTDADLFLIVQLFDPDGKEVIFQGALDPNTPIAQGWLRASHRKLDPARSLPWRPFHPHDERRPLQPGEIVSLDIEIWPTCIVVPRGYRIGLWVRGKDYVYEGGNALKLSNMKNAFNGCGPFLHDDPRDRPPELFGGITTIHASLDHENFLLLPLVPPTSR